MKGRDILEFLHDLKEKPKQPSKLYSDVLHAEGYNEHRMKVNQKIKKFVNKYLPEYKEQF